MFRSRLLIFKVFYVLVLILLYVVVQLTCGAGNTWYRTRLHADTLWYWHFLY